MGTVSNSDKKDTTEGSSASRSNISLRCGDCLHFKGSIHPAYGQQCSSLGIKSYAAAPKCYTANVNVFRKLSSEAFGVLAVLVSNFTPQQSRVFMGLLKGAGSLEKHGFSFLQKVYFRLGEDYLDNYYTGYVMGTGLNQTLMIVGQSFFKALRSPLVAHLGASSVLSAESFAKRKKRLIKEGKLYVPRKAHKSNVTAPDYTPPSIETSADVLEAIAAKAAGKKMKRKGVLEVDLSKVRSRVDDGEGDD